MTDPREDSDARSLAPAWQDLNLDRARTMGSASACLAAAVRLTDQVRRQLATDPELHGAFTDDDPGWARTALAAYQYLADTRAYAHLDPPVLRRCRAEPHRLWAWLTAPDGPPGAAPITGGASGVDEQFAWDCEGVGTHMAAVLERAQRAGVYGVPGYTITLRQITTDDGDTDPIIEHQVTVTTPSGATLASPPIAADHLADDDLSGVHAALAVLTNSAAIVDELLGLEAAMVTGGDAAARRRRAPLPAVPTRGFVELSRPGNGPPTADPPPPSPPGPDRSQRR